MRSIFQHNTPGCNALKIGIGRPDSRRPDDITHYVLSNYNHEQLDILQNQVFDKCYKLLEKGEFL